MFICKPRSLIFFFFNDTATTEIYTLSLHDALPISAGACAQVPAPAAIRQIGALPLRTPCSPCSTLRSHRSEEHTSELQSQSNLVCRLLLEKKKNNITMTTVSLLQLAVAHPDLKHTF